MKNTDEFLTMRQAAALLSCSTDSIRRHILSGTLKAVNIGTRKRHVYRIHRDALDALEVSK